MQPWTNTRERTTFERRSTKQHDRLLTIQPHTIHQLCIQTYTCADRHHKTWTAFAAALKPKISIQQKHMLTDQLSDQPRHFKDFSGLPIDPITVDPGGGSTTHKEPA
jgi:hypothetical protein